jgi:hypothetical protein
MASDPAGRRLPAAILISALLPLGAVIASCANVIGLDGIDRVDCVGDCPAGPDAGGPDAKGTQSPDAHTTKTPDGGARDGKKPVDSGPPGCTKDSACTSASEPRCDVTTGKCVPCLPQNDNCPSGKICTFTTKYECVTGCNTVADCPSPSGGDASTEGGAVDAGSTVACCDHVCVDMSSNVANCGACGTACSANNIATVTCTAGVCDGTCNPGFADCDMNEQTNGCEVKTQGSDIMNCGGCGTICSANNVTATCTAGVCDGMCTAGFADCDMNLQSDGCEVATQGSDPSNCGGCGVVCSGNHVTAATCSAGACTSPCAAGFADCNGNLQSDGCETSVSSNDSDCGSCGKVCPAQTTCSGASCVGCLAGGKVPPSACTSGTDATYGSPWTVCGNATCASAWLSEDNGQVNNQYNALAVCNSLGYGAVGPNYGGTGGSTCGLSQPTASCSAPGTQSFTLALSSEPIFYWVYWECLP